MKALIVGITGQDGSYLAEQLLEKGYEVHGMVRWSSAPNHFRIQDIRDKLHLHVGDITDAASLQNLISGVQPDEIYNLAAISSTRYYLSASIAETTGMGPVNIFDAVLNSPTKRDIKIFQASSSEMLDLGCPPQDENTRHVPRSPYGAAKLFAHNMAHIYREQYGMFISCGVLFNHESPRRTEDFVSRKISMAVAKIARKQQMYLRLWNVSTIRDWGYAPEYTDAMWRMLQREKSGEFVIGTGEPHSIADFLDCAFSHVGLKWQDHVQMPVYEPVTDKPKASIQKANIVLDWKPTTKFTELVRLMVDHDLKMLET